MAAYLVADVDITDAAVFEEYRLKVPATEARYGGDIWDVVERPKCSKAIGNLIALSLSSSRIWLPSWHGTVSRIPPAQSDP